MQMFSDLAWGRICRQLSSAALYTYRAAPWLDDLQDALARPSCANWAARTAKHTQSFGLPAPSAHDGAGLIDNSSLRHRAAGKYQEVYRVMSQTLTGLAWFPQVCNLHGQALHISWLICAHHSSTTAILAAAPQ